MHPVYDDPTILIHFPLYPFPHNFQESIQKKIPSSQGDLQIFVRGLRGKIGTTLVEINAGDTCKDLKSRFGAERLLRNGRHLQDDNDTFAPHDTIDVLGRLRGGMRIRDLPENESSSTSEAMHSVPSGVVKVAFGNESVRKASTTTTATVEPTAARSRSKVTPLFHPENAAENERINKATLDNTSPAETGYQVWWLGDFGIVMTTFIKTKSWGLYLWYWFLVLCMTSTYAVMESTNPFLLWVCAFVPASLMAIYAYETFAWPGMSVVGLWYAGLGVAKWHFSKQIAMMEVWSEMFEQADLNIGLDDLKREQLELDKGMSPEELAKRSQDTVLLLFFFISFLISVPLPILSSLNISHQCVTQFSQELARTGPT